jgi:hypothetical protein
MPVIPTLRRLRQEDHEFKTSLCYIARTCLKNIFFNLFCFNKHGQESKNTTYRLWGKIFACHVFDKVLVSRIHEGLLLNT